MNGDDGIRHEETTEFSLYAGEALLPDPLSIASTDISVPEDLSTKVKTPDRSVRSYSKKNRVYVLREFLLDTYSDYLSPDDIVLDVAGGKGDLSWILRNVDDMQSVVVDPRRTINHIDKSVAYLRAHPEECRKRAVPGEHTYQPIAALMPQLQQKKFALVSPDHMRIFVNQALIDAVQDVLTKESGCLDRWDIYWRDATKETEGFVTPTGKNDFSLDTVEDVVPGMDASTALDLILNAKLLVGFHPDQATDFCFLLAKLLNIPSCVVPCCVFPTEFPDRRLHHEDEDFFVQRYEDLIQFILQENENVQIANLPFLGTKTARKIVMYTLPRPDSA